MQVELTRHETAEQRKSAYATQRIIYLKIQSESYFISLNLKNIMMLWAEWLRIYRKEFCGSSVAL